MKKERKQSIPRFPRERTVPVGEEWSSQKVFDKVHSYVNSQIHFIHKWESVVVTLWTMGTYLHRQFSCYGHLWLNSPTKRAGKTKLLDVLHGLCYKSSAPQLQPTSAVLFRFASAFGGTLLLDEVDNLDPKRFSDVIAVLNSYHKQGEVMRAMPGKNRKITLVKYPIYCPKVIAGIESLPVTLQDRCIRIVFQRKTLDEKVQRFMPEDHARLEPVRDQLEAWSVRKAFPIIRAYGDRDHLGVPQEVNDDRVRDILEPLFAVASVLSKRVQATLVEGTVEIVKGRKYEDSEVDPVVAAVQILTQHFPKHEEVWKLRTATACTLLEEIPGIEDKNKVRALLRKLGFHSENCRFPKKKVLMAYKIPKRTLERLNERYPAK
jgi:hypothetical protein